MKKLLLSLGAIASVAAPVAAVVACGSTDSESKVNKLKDNYKAAINRFAPDSEKAGLLAKVDAIKTVADAEALLQAEPKLAMAVTELAKDNATKTPTITVEDVEADVTSTLKLTVAQGVDTNQFDNLGKTAKDLADAFGIKLPSTVEATSPIYNVNTSLGMEPKTVVFIVGDKAFPSSSDHKVTLTFTSFAA